MIELALGVGFFITIKNSLKVRRITPIYEDIESCIPKVGPMGPKSDLGKVNPGISQFEPGAKYFLEYKHRICGSFSRFNQPASPHYQCSIPPTGIGSKM